MQIKRNILLNPGPATTTDTVKMAQVVPDICPREKEFAGLMKGLRSDLLKVVHAPADQYTAVLFCGSGTINIDICEGMDYNIKLTTRMDVLIGEKIYDDYFRMRK